MSFFLFGIQDAFLPYGLVNLILFYFVLSYYAQTFKKAVFATVIFILVFILIDVLFVLSFLDQLLIQRSYIKSAQWFYLFIGIVFILSACIHLFQWWQLKAGSVMRAAFVYPVSAKGWPLKVLCIAVSGTLFSGIWQEEILFGVYADWFNHRQQGILNYVTWYLAGQVFVFVSILFLFKYIQQQSSAVFISMKKVIYSAVLFAAGIGLIYLYAKLS